MAGGVAAELDEHVGERGGADRKRAGGRVVLAARAERDWRRCGNVSSPRGGPMCHRDGDPRVRVQRQMWAVVLE